MPTNDKECFVVFSFFFGIYALTGLHLFMGELKKKCVFFSLGV